MPVGLVLAVAAALCRGGAAVLQSLGAARVAQFPGVDLRLFLGAGDRSASLVVVAVLGATLLRERLPRTEEAAVVAVVPASDITTVGRTLAPGVVG